MKAKIIYILLAIFFINCKSQTKEDKDVTVNIQAKNTVTDNRNQNYEIAPINFLEKKYQQNGFILPDNLKPPTYPSFTSSDNKFIFTVNYIGKTELEQNYWDVQNSTGFFSQFENIDIAIGNSKIIDQKVKDVLKTKSNDYHIIAEFLPEEGIQKYNVDGSGDFELKEGALSYFYLYENNKWVFIKKINKIDKNGIELYNDLLLEYKLTKVKSIDKKFQGDFSVFVETESTTNGMANITYYFKILKDKILLKTNTYHEPISCNGEYKAVENNNILELYYIENKDEHCKKINSSFSIKKENDKFYIKGIGGEGTFHDWIEIIKEKN